MVNTHASGSGNNNNEENPTLAQVLAQQTQLINMLVQQMQNQQGNSGAAATCSTPPSSPAELHPRRAVASVVAAGRRHRRKVRGRVEKPGRSLPAVSGHRSPVAAVDRSRAAARPRRRPSSFVVWFEGEYRWVRLVVLYVYMSSKVAADHPISGKVAILCARLRSGEKSTGVAGESMPLVFEGVIMIQERCAVMDYVVQGWYTSGQSKTIRIAVPAVMGGLSNVFRD
uniref:Uncharacterized protein n=1 Tax=Oryza sativa subsp. japonica TaxID=39947 RepID=Q651G5_ORYSJ|nr:unknown protein [Oryza sativa Japonica Group]